MSKTKAAQPSFKKRDRVKFTTHHGRTGAGIVSEIRIAANGSTWYDLVDDQKQRVASMRASQMQPA